MSIPKSSVTACRIAIAFVLVAHLALAWWTELAEWQALLHGIISAIAIFEIPTLVYRFILPLAMHGWDAFNHPEFFAAVAREARQEGNIKDNLYQESQYSMLVFTAVWVGFGAKATNPLYMLIALGTFEVCMLVELMLIHSAPHI